MMANENGMAENFHAQTGQGSRDLAFTWTSSVFLILANEYLLEKVDEGILHKEERRKAQWGTCVFLLVRAWHK